VRDDGVRVPRWLVALTFLFGAVVAVADISLSSPQMEVAM
jgi:hypothetical protein